jgi:hypothetical protein
VIVGAYGSGGCGQRAGLISSSVPISQVLDQIFICHISVDQGTLVLLTPPAPRPCHRDAHPQSCALGVQFRCARHLRSGSYRTSPDPILRTIQTSGSSLVTCCGPMGCYSPSTHSHRMLTSIYRSHRALTSLWSSLKLRIPYAKRRSWDSATRHGLLLRQPCHDFTKWCLTGYSTFISERQLSFLGK